MTLDVLRDGDPRQVGPYTLLGRLGEGGMGVVYLARSPDGTRVAVKLIHAMMDANPGFRRRFAREVAAAQRVARFCTAPVLDADVEGQPPYLVTEYVEGPSLGQAVRESGPLKGSALDGLAAAMAMALRAIHGAGVVHRDLKPSNVLLSQVGPKVIDFGIARLADAEVSSGVLGTPAYMSPEQASGDEVGPASDIFAWGGTMAFAAGGLPPFGSGPAPAMLLRIVNEPPDLRGLSGPLRDLVESALSKNPADRPTAQDLMDRLSVGDVAPLAPVAPAEPSSPSPAAAPAEPSSPPPAAAPSAAPPDTVPPASPDAATPPTNASRARTRRRLLTATAALVVAAGGISAALALRGPDDDTPARTTTATPTGTATSGNPLTTTENVTFYAPKEPQATRQAGIWAKDRKADADLMSKLAAVPFAIRLNEPEEAAGRVREAARKGGVPVFLINSMPGGDCRPVPAADMTRYEQWIGGVARQIGQARAVVILEPSSLTNLPGTKNCDPQGTPDQRYQGLEQAVESLKANQNTAVYLDGAQGEWPGVDLMAERLIGAGVSKADGFFTNTAAFQATDKSVEYGKELSACISVRLATKGDDCPADAEANPATMPHFVVDTARNGQGSWAPTKTYKDPQTWCNPPGRGVGERPTTETGEDLVDAYLWIARPGVSGGRCRRGAGGEEDPERGVVSPEAGQWWDVLALERAKNAEPPLS